QRDPEQSVARAHLRPRHRLLVDGELVAQGQVLQGDMAVSTVEEGKQSRQAEQEGDHRVEIFSGSASPDQSLGAGRSFGDGQVEHSVAGAAEVYAVGHALHGASVSLGGGPGRSLACVTGHTARTGASHAWRGTPEW